MLFGAIRYFICKKKFASYQKKNKNINIQPVAPASMRITGARPAPWSCPPARPQAGPARQSCRFAMTNVGSLTSRQKICPCVIARSLGKLAEKRKRCRNAAMPKRNPYLASSGLPETKSTAEPEAKSCG